MNVMLALIQLPANITSIGDGAFDGCTPLSIATQLPTGEGIHENAFPTL